MVQIWLRKGTYQLLAKKRVGREPFGSVIERLLAPIEGDEGNVRMDKKIAAGT